MIHRIIWPERYRSYKDPFSCDQPLRITLHNCSFTNLSSQEHDALNLIRSFSDLDDIEVYGFSDEDSPRISFRREPGDEDFSLKVIWNDGRWSIHSGFAQGQVNRKFLDKSTTQILKVEDYDDPEVLKSPTNDLMFVEAHIAIRNHIFVTASEYVHEFKDNYEDANVRLPTEALKIVGIFLGSRGLWLYRPHFSTAPRMFYTHKAYINIPNLEKFHKSFGKAHTKIREGLSEHSLSFLEKCRRVLRTKDYLGNLFYKMQSYEILDEQLYYFNYLTLLLGGAFDSLAEVSSLLFKPAFDGPASFRNKTRKKSFVEGLKNAGVNNLANLVTNDYAIKLQSMLFELRNSIHGVLPSGTTQKDFDRNDNSFIEVDSEYRDKIWEISHQIEKHEAWGLKLENYSIYRDDKTLEKAYRIKLEPFNYANQLIAIWFVFFDRILETFTQTDNKVSISHEDVELRKIVQLLG